jgi:hypothetical protein
MRPSWQTYEVDAITTSPDLDESAQGRAGKTMSRSGLGVTAVALALGATTSVNAQPNDTHITVCRGDLYRAERPADPRYENASWIGNCYFKFNAKSASVILDTCHYRQPCTVKATVFNKEIIEVHRVELDGRDTTCRGKLINTDKESGDTAKIGSCRFTIDLYPGVAKAILDACRYGRSCVVRARVSAGEITHVYSATRP